ncbi:MAG: hypothetical protein ACU0C9_11760, partial [Paracoccaceae bacterium]
DGALQSQAFERAGFEGDKGRLEFGFADLKLIHLSGRGARARIVDTCKTADVVIVTVKLSAANFECDVYDPVRLRETGSLAMIKGSDGIEIISAKSIAGQRLWNSADVRTGALRFKTNRW